MFGKIPARGLSGRHDAGAIFVRQAKPLQPVPDQPDVRRDLVRRGRQTAQFRDPGVIPPGNMRSDRRAARRRFRCSVALPGTVVGGTGG